MSIVDNSLAKRPPDDPFLVSTTADRKFAHWRIVLEKPDDIEQDSVSEASCETEEDIEYDIEEFISKPSKSKKWSFSEDFLPTHYSFGYDSTKIFNLVAVDEDTLIFGSGALLHIFDIPTRQLTFRRTAGGGGVGHITKNLAFPHIAIGEKGVNPLIIVYEWPSFQVISVLKEGTTKEYTHLNFSSDGKHLVSQGGEPDFLITVWNWKRGEIMLQVKSHTQDVFNVEFSRYFPGNLTSSGLGHIKFWKMAKTFTGLKLQGEIGKFGKTEICDIMGLYAMPDEKVLTGCEWGNILVWDEGMIKMQVARKLEGMPCHQGPITHFAYNHDDGYLLTAGLDGFIKIWFYRYINEQNPPDTDPFVRIEPSFSIEVKDEIGRAQLVSLSKVDENPLNHRYFGQDYSGLWSIDAEMKSDLPKPVRLYCCHKGPIFDMAISPISHHLVTIAQNARLHVYDIEKRKLLLVKQFKTDIKVLLWLPVNVSKSGTVFIGGFVDGTIKIFVIDMDKISIDDENLLGDYVHITFSEKFHVGIISKLALDKEGTMLVSGGVDCCVFANRIVTTDQDSIQLEPIGFINTPASVTSICCKHDQSPTFLVCCSDGHFLEVTFPLQRESFEVVSYELHNLATKLRRFASIKSEILRSIELQEIANRKQAKLDAKKAELEKLKKENPHLDINEEIYLVDSDVEIELPPLYLPKDPTPILFGTYDEEGFAWLSVGGYDAGYLYKCDLNAEYDKQPMEHRLISLEDEIVSSCNMTSSDLHLKFFGLSNGVIRVVNISDDLSDDFCDYLDVPIHDNVYGRVTKLVISHDKKYLCSCGDDSNIFAFRIMLPGLLADEEEGEEVGYSGLSDKIVALPDEGPGANLSLEEEKKRIEDLQRKHEAETRKEEVRKRLKNCKERFLKIMEKNNSLPAQYRLTPEQLEIDPRVTAHLDEKLQSELDLVKRKLSFDLEKSKLLYEKVHCYFIKPLAAFKVSVASIGKDLHVTTFVHKQLDEEFNKNYEKLVKTYKPDLRNEIRMEKIKPIVIEEEPEFVPVPLMPWLRGEDNFYDKLNSQTLRALDRHLARQKYNENREAEWRSFMNSKPDINKLDAKDLLRIDFAQRTIGDYKLKTSADYKVPRQLRVSVAQKHRQLLIVRKNVYDEKNSFNKKVMRLRDEKVQMVKEFRKLHAVLNELHKEIDESLRKEPPSIPSIDVDAEFPERKFQLHPQEIGIEDTAIHQSIDEELSYLYPELQFKCKDDIINEEETSWTKEKKVMRTVRRLVEQDSIISSMETIIKEHNKRVAKLNWEKLEISVKIKMLEIFQLTVYQELVTIKCFERLENELMDRVEAMLALRSIEMFKINRNRKKIVYATREINALQDKENDVLRIFQESVFESKFVEFLTKVYKKKYKPPKKKKDDESESSSSEESSSDDDESESSDEGEMKIIKFDENICPEGCDPDLYKRTFVLRGRRHELELEIIEVKKRVDSLKKENEMSGKRLLQIDVVLRLHLEKLESFQRQKQRKVNEVETVVVLKSDQLLNYKKSDEMGSIGNSVLMPMDSLKKLNDRVGELENETKAEQLKHEQYKTHLQRMRVDVKAMEAQIEELKKKIKNEKMIKFGAEINIDRLEDSVLKEMILAVRFDITSLQQDMEKKLNAFKETILAKAEEKAKIQRENTNKFQMLSSLQDEKTKVKQMLNAQRIKKTKLQDKDIFENEINMDIKHLEELLKELNTQREAILHEIRILSLKGRPLPPITKAGPTPRERVPKRRSAPVLERIDSEELELKTEVPAKPRSASMTLKLTKPTPRKSSNVSIEVPQVDLGLKSGRESDTDTESPSTELPSGIEAAQDSQLYDMCANIVDQIVNECTDSLGYEIAREVLEIVVKDIGEDITSKEKDRFEGVEEDGSRREKIRFEEKIEKFTEKHGVEDDALESGAQSLEDKNEEYKFTAMGSEGDLCEGETNNVERKLNAIDEEDIEVDAARSVGQILEDKLKAIVVGTDIGEEVVENKETNTSEKSGNLEGETNVGKNVSKIRGEDLGDKLQEVSGKQGTTSDVIRGNVQGLEEELGVINSEHEIKSMGGPVPEKEIGEDVLGKEKRYVDEYDDERQDNVEIKWTKPEKVDEEGGEDSGGKVEDGKEGGHGDDKEKEEGGEE
ncbi:cilia- and flagella-associated protein 44 [Nilaparvata lugens]|uniref:cilia- and flagella-associated protein 44 n=1 Tax=Nilaparvata lugens TaxID=108931 RepID=UPI00193DB3BD|nr:cilia- and flagella-associated protein 44 [Nilaparvata lugens]